MSHKNASVVAIALLAGAATSVRAADVTWNNGSGNLLWDTSSLNWSTGAWNNANGDGAIFGATGVGTINVNSPIFVNSLNFTADGYVLNGAGSLNIANGTSTQTTAVANVATGMNTVFNVGVNSALAFQKIGGGVLTLSAPCLISGNVPIVPNFVLAADLLVGGSFGNLNGGTLRIGNSSVLAPSTRVSIGTGFLDIGANNVTLAQLMFTNTVDNTPWNPVINAAGNGVIGSGTLRVTGDISVEGSFGGNAGNTVAANLDLGGGTQIVRIGAGSSFGLQSALQFTGVLSNGSLLKTYGVNPNGAQTTTDGMGLYGNNTYTGATILNAGTTVVTGTNASTRVEIAGSAGIGGGSVTLQGANGSYGAATLLQAFAGGLFVLDNNAALGAGGQNSPPVAAAQNNDRIRDDAEVQLRDGAFTFRGLSTAAATETFGSLNVLGGHNVLTLAPTGTGGTATLTASGNLTLSSRSTMLVTTTTLGAASKFFVNGTIPTPDSTGILRRIVGGTDFLTYNGTTGLTPFTGYATDFSTPGTNVTYSATGAVASSVNITALRNTAGASTTLTIGAGQTLGIDSGMILNSGFGTATITGGTLAFGANPGVMFGAGSIILGGAVTGSDGLIIARGTTTFAATSDFSGLTGAVDINSGTLNLTTNTFVGPINVRNATLNINTNQTLAGQGAITLGVAQNDANLVGLPSTISFSGAGANAIIGRDLIVDNGFQNVAGVEHRYPLLPGLSPLSNTTGSQTWSGNVILNSSVRLQGGGAAAASTGSTNFTGNVSGPATFYLANGRVNFSGNVSNAGGFLLGDQGFSAKTTFSGTTTGSAPIRQSGGNGNTLSYNAGSLPTGLLTIFNSSASTAPQIIPLQNSTINNTIRFDGDATANVATGIIAEWAGMLTGSSPLTKIGAGSLVLSNVANTYSGAVTVSAGDLRVNGNLNASAVTVAALGTLGGVGSITGPTAVVGALSPGNSIGTLGLGSLTLTGSLNSEIDANFGAGGFADLVASAGNVTLGAASTLNLTLTNLPTELHTVHSYILISNAGVNAVTGTFAAINASLPAGYSLSVEYAFSGTDSTGRVGDGNDVALVLVPAPGSASLVMLGLAVMSRRRR